MSLPKPLAWLRMKFRSLSQDRRASIYARVPFATAALVSSGFIADGTAQWVLIVAGAVLGVGANAVAKANTPHVDSGHVVRTFKPGD